MLANDPNTAKFISTELARHFVSDNPPPALVDRMAAEYSDEQQRRHSQRAENDDLFAGVLVQGSLSREGEDAVRAGRQHGARA